MIDIQIIIAYLGILIAVLLRSLLPIINKIKEDPENFHWDQTYTATAISATIVAFITAGLAFPSFPLPTDTVTIVGLFWLAFAYGWGLNDFFNKIFADLHSTTPTITVHGETVPTPGK